MNDFKKWRKDNKDLCDIYVFPSGKDIACWGLCIVMFMIYIFLY